MGKSCFLILKKENKLKEFDGRLFRTILGPQREEVTGD
jgi:hypothetical protein